jgi:hypothetical protein
MLWLTYHSFLWYRYIFGSFSYIFKISFVFREYWVFLAIILIKVSKYIKIEQKIYHISLRRAILESYFYQSDLSCYVSMSLYCTVYIHVSMSLYCTVYIHVSMSLYCTVYIHVSMSLYCIAYIHVSMSLYCTVLYIY